VEGLNILQKKFIMRPASQVRQSQKKTLPFLFISWKIFSNTGGKVPESQPAALISPHGTHQHVMKNFMS
jgi:hypothetical protein